MQHLGFVPGAGTNYALAMSDWLILLLLVPAIIAPVVLLVGFAGCKFEHGQVDPYLAIDSAKGKNPYTVTLAWSFDTALVSFNFVRVKLPSRSETGTFTAAAQPPSGSSRIVQFMDDPDILEPGTRYEYTVEGIASDGESVTSSPVEVTTFDISFLSIVQT